MAEWISEGFSVRCIAHKTVFARGDSCPKCSLVSTASAPIEIVETSDMIREHEAFFLDVSRSALEAAESTDVLLEKARMWEVAVKARSRCADYTVAREKILLTQRTVDMAKRVRGG